MFKPSWLRSVKKKYVNKTEYYRRYSEKKCVSCQIGALKKNIQEEEMKEGRKEE